ncbi:MAG: hypothetical protein WBQ34_06275 [Candidatus Acidiferrales bacterium]
MTPLDDLRKLSTTLLYEGCMLYPYRASALKNQRPGWTFGALLPPVYVARNRGESDRMQSQVLANIPEDAELALEVRFLQLHAAANDQRSSPAVERCVSVSGSADSLLSSAAASTFAFPLADSPAAQIDGTAEIGAERIKGCTCRVTIRVRNISSTPAEILENRDAALNYAFLSLNALLTLSGGEFISLLDPPDELREAAARCRQIGVYPVLAGDARTRSGMLISPIILYDFPQVAPESKGDFFDSSEIDEILALRVLTLSDAEREEIQRNQSGYEILSRTNDLSPAEMRRMHGTFRSPPDAERNR